MTCCWLLAGLVLLPGDPVPILRELPPLSVRGINYYPSATPWDGFWTATPADVIERDMALAAAYGINTVRTFLPVNEKTTAAGLTATDGTVTELYLARFEAFLAAAWSCGIRTVACFAFENHAAPRVPAGWRQAMAGFVTPHRDDGRILMWDLMNEPERHDWDAETMAYLTAALPLVKELAPQQFSTVGIGWQIERLAPAGLPDVLQYHNYAPKAEMFDHGLQRVGQTVARLREFGGERPVLIGEFGMSTARDPVHGAGPEWDARLDPPPGTEAEQVLLYGLTLNAAEAWGVAGVMPWCLHEHPARESGFLTPRESMFGLFRLDGTPKPAALLLREVYRKWAGQR